MSEPEKSAENVQPFTWHGPEEEAAVLLAEDEDTDEEIAARVGVSVRQLGRWKAHPEFRQRVADLAAKMGRTALRYAIARVGRRVRALDDRWRRMQQVIEERAADPGLWDVPGGRTGLVVHDVKGVGKGEDFQLIDLYSVDTALLKELRAHEQQAAQELGQWVNKVAPTTPDGDEAFDAGGFTADEVTAILEGLAARLGLAPAGPDGEEPEVPAGPAEA